MAKRTKTVLAGMDFQALLDLRGQVDKALSDFRTTLERQLEALGSSVASVATRGRGSMKGRKVKAKYRSPDGITTWAGRGAVPKWMTEAIKAGKTREDFLIDKNAAKATKARGKKGRAKKRRKSKR